MQPLTRTTFAHNKFYTCRYNPEHTDGSPAETYYRELCFTPKHSLNPNKHLVEKLNELYHTGQTLISLGQNLVADDNENGDTNNSNKSKNKKTTTTTTFVTVDFLTDPQCYIGPSQVKLFFEVLQKYSVCGVPIRRLCFEFGDTLELGQMLWKMLETSSSSSADQSSSSYSLGFLRELVVDARSEVIGAGPFFLKLLRKFPRIIKFAIASENLKILGGDYASYYQACLTQAEVNRSNLSSVADEIAESSVTEVALESPRRRVKKSVVGAQEQEDESRSDSNNKKKHEAHQPESVLLTVSESRKRNEERARKELTSTFRGGVPESWDRRFSNRLPEDQQHEVLSKVIISSSDDDAQKLENKEKEEDEKEHLLSQFFFSRGVPLIEIDASSGVFDKESDAIRAFEAIASSHRTGKFFDKSFDQERMLLGSHYDKFSSHSSPSTTNQDQVVFHRCFDPNPPMMKKVSQASSSSATSAEPVSTHQYHQQQQASTSSSAVPPSQQYFSSASPTSQTLVPIEEESLNTPPRQFDTSTSMSTTTTNINTNDNSLHVAHNDDFGENVNNPYSRNSVVLFSSPVGLPIALRRGSHDIIRGDNRLASPRVIKTMIDDSSAVDDDNNERVSKTVLVSTPANNNCSHASFATPTTSRIVTSTSMNAGATSTSRLNTMKTGGGVFTSPTRVVNPVSAPPAFGEEPTANLFNSDSTIESGKLSSTRYLAQALSVGISQNANALFSSLFVRAEPRAGVALIALQCPVRGKKIYILVDDRVPLLSCKPHTHHAHHEHHHQPVEDVKQLCLLRQQKSVLTSLSALFAKHITKMSNNNNNKFTNNSSCSTKAASSDFLVSYAAPSGSSTASAIISRHQELAMRLNRIVKEQHQQQDDINIDDAHNKNQTRTSTTIQRQDQALSSPVFLTNPFALAFFESVRTCPWIPLLEKAVAKLFGSYCAMSRGNFQMGLEMILGGSAAEFVFPDFSSGAATTPGCSSHVVEEGFAYFGHHLFHPNSLHQTQHQDHQHQHHLQHHDHNKDSSSLGSNQQQQQQHYVSPTSSPSLLSPSSSSQPQQLTANTNQQQQQQQQQQQTSSVIRNAIIVARSEAETPEAARSLAERGLAPEEMFLVEKTFEIDEYDMSKSQFNTTNKNSKNQHDDEHENSTHHRTPPHVSHQQFRLFRLRAIEHHQQQQRQQKQHQFCIGLRNTLFSEGTVLHKKWAARLGCVPMQIIVNNHQNNNENEQHEEEEISDHHPYKSETNNAIKHNNNIPSPHPPPQPRSIGENPNQSSQKSGLSRGPGSFRSGMFGATPTTATTTGVAHRKNHTSSASSISLVVEHIDLNSGDDDEFDDESGSTTTKTTPTTRMTPNKQQAPEQNKPKPNRMIESTLVGPLAALSFGDSSNKMGSSERTAEAENQNIKINNNNTNNQEHQNIHANSTSTRSGGSIRGKTALSPTFIEDDDETERKRRTANRSKVDESKAAKQLSSDSFLVTAEDFFVTFRAALVLSFTHNQTPTTDVHRERIPLKINLKRTYMSKILQHLVSSSVEQQSSKSGGGHSPSLGSFRSSSIPASLLSLRRESYRSWLEYSPAFVVRNVSGKHSIRLVAGIADHVNLSKSTASNNIHNKQFIGLQISVLNLKQDAVVSTENSVTNFLSSRHSQQTLREIPVPRQFCWNAEKDLMFETPVVFNGTVSLDVKLTPRAALSNSCLYVVVSACYVALNKEDEEKEMEKRNDEKGVETPPKSAEMFLQCWLDGGSSEEIFIQRVNDRIHAVTSKTEFVDSTAATTLEMDDFVSRHSRLLKKNDRTEGEAEQEHQDEHTSRQQQPSSQTLSVSNNTQHYDSDRFDSPIRVNSDHAFPPTSANHHQLSPSKTKLESEMMTEEENEREKQRLAYEKCRLFSDLASKTSMPLLYPNRLSRTFTLADFPQFLIRFSHLPIPPKIVAPLPRSRRASSTASRRQSTATLFGIFGTSPQAHSLLSVNSATSPESPGGQSSASAGYANRPPHFSPGQSSFAGSGGGIGGGASSYLHHHEGGGGLPNQTIHNDVAVTILVEIPHLKGASPLSRTRVGFAVFQLEDETTELNINQQINNDNNNINQKLVFPTSSSSSAVSPVSQQHVSSPNMNLNNNKHNNSNNVAYLNQLLHPTKRFKSFDELSKACSATRWSAASNLNIAGAGNTSVGENCVFTSTKDGGGIPCLFHRHAFGPAISMRLPLAPPPITQQLRDGGQMSARKMSAHLDSLSEPPNWLADMNANNNNNNNNNDSKADNSGGNQRKSSLQQNEHNNNLPTSSNTSSLRQTPQQSKLTPVANSIATNSPAGSVISKATTLQQSPGVGKNHYHHQPAPPASSSQQQNRKYISRTFLVVPSFIGELKDGFSDEVVTMMMHSDTEENIMKEIYTTVYARNVLNLSVTPLSK